MLGRFLEEATAGDAFLAGRGACVEQHGAGEAYLPFLQALQQLLSGPRRDRVLALFRRFAPTWCIQFSSLFSNTTVDQFQREAIGSTRERMLRELGDVLTELTGTTRVGDQISSAVRAKPHIERSAQRAARLKRAMGRERRKRRNLNLTLEQVVRMGLHHPLV